MKYLRLLIIVLICIFTLSACDKSISKQNMELLNEYKLLLIDLANINTHGYKSHIKSVYDENISRVSEIININQGSLQETGVETDFAIVGEGFFKIRLENDRVGYTRNGNFKIDSEGSFVTRDGYPFYENIKVPELFLPSTIEIERDGRIFVGIFETGNIVIKEIGQLSVYEVPAEILVHDKNAIYVIKDNVDIKEELKTLNTNLKDEPYRRTVVYNKFLEMSNSYIMEICYRMLYILYEVDDNTIKNREFKIELLKNIAIPRKIETMEEYNNRISYINGILQYLRYDY